MAVMSARIGCLGLLLVLVASWTDNLQEGTFRVAPRRAPAFGAEVYPIARTYQIELQQHLDQLPRAESNPGTIDLTSNLVSFPAHFSRKPVPLRFASADPCYVQMSLQV
jgi:hypothetical protein